MLALTMLPAVAAGAPTIAEVSSGLSADSQPTGIAAGPDGNLWFTQQGNSGAIGRITPAGVITEFTAGLSANAKPTEITAGPDGNLWFTEQGNSGAIGRITPAGVITEFTDGLSVDSEPTGIAAGPDGNLWFTEQANPGRIGRISFDSSSTPGGTDPSSATPRRSRRPAPSPPSAGRSQPLRSPGSSASRLPGRVATSVSTARRRSPPAR